MTKMQKKLSALLLLAFVAGVFVGHFKGQALFGYKSIEECRANETKGVMIGAAAHAAREYCDSLFPAPAPPAEAATEAVAIDAADAAAIDAAATVPSEAPPSDAGSDKIGCRPGQVVNGFRIVSC